MPAPPVPADVWAAPSETVNAPEPEPVSYASAETAGQDAAVSAASPDPVAEESGMDAVPAPRSAGPDPFAAAPRTDTAAAARVFDAATTRRRSVVFEEDDELDVPDFLK
jgi:cell division protein FtsZ